LLLAALLFAPATFAQESRGSIVGRVLDSSGAVIPGAQVKATHQDTNIAATATANAQGNYELLYLSPGVYTVTATTPGFKQYSRAGVEIQAGGEISLEIKLEPGLVTESITVSETASVLEASTSLGQVVDNKRITELPLAGGNPYTLTQLTAGVVYFGAPNHPNLAPAVEVVSNIGVSGVRSYNTEFTLDGAPSMWGRNASFVPPSDMVSEFKVETSRFDAGSRSPGGAVNVALRSGTNQLHGTFAEYHSDNKLNSIDFFQRRFLYDLSSGPVNDEKRRSVNPQFIINRFGATVGGPVYLPRVYDGRNRTFWIFGFEGLTRPSQERGDYLHTVPTLAQRDGDFSALLQAGSQYQIYDPTTIAPAANNRYSRQPLPGNIIPKSRIDPMAKRLLDYWPQPNLPGRANGEDNYWGVLSSYNEYFSYTTRIDHAFSENHRMFGRYNQSRQYFDSNKTLPTIATGSRRFRYNKGFGLDDVYILSPRLLLNVRYSLTRFIQRNSPTSLGFDLLGAGFPSSLVSSIDPRGVIFPQITVDAYDTIGNTQPTATTTNYHTWGLDFTRMQGNHSLRFGGEYRLYRAHNANFNFQTPSLAFSTGWTRGPLDNSAASPIGQGLASFLYGLPTGGQGQINASYAEQTTYTAGFIQDNYKVTPRLTLNLGLRYEFETAPTERFNRTVSGYDFVTVNPIQAQAAANYAASPIPEIAAANFKAIGGLTFAGVGGNGRSLWRTERDNISPRIGVAYRLGAATILRGGYGLYYITNGVDRLNVDQTGFTLSTTLVPSLDNGQTFVATLSNPFPNGYQQPRGADGGLSTNLGRAITFFNEERPHGKTHRMTVGLQRQLPHHILAEVSYVATAGTQLDVSKQWNAVPREYLSTSPVRDATAINFLTAQVNNPFYPMLTGTDFGSRTVARQQLLRPYPQFNGITSTTQNGWSWYHAMQLRLERRLRGGLTVQGNYTWSKYMEATSYLNQTDDALEYVISDQDRAQRFVASGIWELPFGRGRRFGANWSRAPRYAISGWQLAATYQGQSGAPLAFGNVLYYGLIGDIPLDRSQRSVDLWYNTADFEKLSARQLANNIRAFPSRLTGVRGPGVNIWNASVLRTFRINERVRLQFRGEALNAANHSFLANPNMTATAAAFGTIAATTGYPRQFYFGLKLLY
jgi:hypothetical protein